MLVSLSLALLISTARVASDVAQPLSAEKSTETCECFFQLQLSRDTDLGQRVVETLAAMTMAEQHKCTFLFDRDGFVRGDYSYGGDGFGEFSRALQFLQLHADELVLDDLKVSENDEKPRIRHTLDLVKWPFERLPHLCGTLFRARLDNAYLCRDAKDKPKPCISFSKYDNFKWRKRKSGLSSRSPPTSGLRERFSRQIQPRVVPADIAITVGFHLYDPNNHVHHQTHSQPARQQSNH